MNQTISGKFNPKLASKVPWTQWRDFEENPVVEPYYADVVADPAVVLPEEAPDGKWHMYICATWNTILHLISSDGKSWEPVEMYDWPGFSPYIIKDDGRFYIFYQRNDRLNDICYIACRYSDDLNHWSERHDIIKPELDWEKQELRPTVRNACVVKVDDRYRLYYSGGVKIIPDLKFEEPACIGVAESDSILGPYVKRETPLFSPDKNDSYRNFGAGAMKVLYLEDKNIFVGFNNGIYWADGHSRSALHMLVSEDGYDWYDMPGNPILSPEPGWKESLVYQICVKQVEDSIWAYYNCRQGWEKGIERIGLAFGEKS